MFNIISKSLDVNGNLCEIVDKYFKYTSKRRKIIEDKYDSQFEDYRENNQKDKEKYVNDKLSKLPLHEK